MPPPSGQPSFLYFDNAATSFPKPPAVYDAMLRYATELGTSARGRYAPAVESARLVNQCRQRIARLVHHTSPDHVVFTLNTSDALNMAIKGVVDASRSASSLTPHVVTTWMDHNSVLRPYNALASSSVSQTRVPVDPRTGIVDPQDVKHAIENAPAGSAPVLVSILHASNVTGSIQPIAEIGAICRDAGVLFLVDAAQSLGHLEVDMQSANIDLLAFAGHKGLLGPTGTGGLVIRPGVELRMRTVREGGTGSRSELDTHPTFMPDRFEPGSHNTLGVIGLSEGVNYLLEQGPAIRSHERELMHAFLDELRVDAEGHVPGARLRLLGPVELNQRVGVFSFTHETLSPVALADALEHQHHILTRPGLHCAPLAHRTFGTSAPSGGAVRFSMGPFLTVEDARTAARALRDVSGAIPTIHVSGASARHGAPA